MSEMPLAGLATVEAIGRAEALVATLETARSLTETDREWMVLAVRSLDSLVGAVNDPTLHASAAAIVAQVSTLPSGGERAADDLREALLGLKAALVDRRADVPAAIALSDIADAARWFAARTAQERDVPVSVDVPDQPTGSVPRPIGGALLDALGLVVRSGVTHGTPDGGALRVVFTSEAAALVVIVSDRGNRAAVNVTARPNVSGERGLSLRAAQSRIVALGGELTAASGAWGGTSVTIRLPLGKVAARPQRGSDP